ncbi:MAG TPA: SIS domain-containing protein, partial [Sporolactobacillaceae bacterium]|nr:SIS domain-containing protein [Sporolactobacillaceae bacterium]
MNAHLTELVEKFPDLSVCLPSIEEAFELLKSCYQMNGKVLLCGNGGSASDCEHIVGELMKGFLLKRPVNEDFRKKLADLPQEEAAYLTENLQGALPALSLVSQTALMTAFSNDVASDLVFAQQVYGYGNPGDVLIGLSTSGNSKNVLYALKVAKAKGL